MSDNQSIEEVFKRTLHKYGNPGHFFDNDIKGLDEVKAILKFAISTHARAYGKNGEIYFEYVDNPSFNALATTNEEYEFIALFSGTIFHLYRLYFAFLSDPLVLPTIGNAGRVNLSSNIINSIAIGTFEVQQPQDKERLILAQNLALITCLLILTHEMGHIIHCHVHLLQKKYAIEVYEELPLLSLKSRRDDLLHAFEWEADEYSGVCTYLFLHHFGRGFPAIRILGLEHTISICSLMSFTYMHKISGGDFHKESHTHPSPFDRWIWITQSIEKHEQFKMINTTSSEMLKGIETVWDFWSRHKLIEKANFDFSEQTLQKTKDNYLKVRSTFNKIGDDLNALNKERKLSSDLWFKTNGKDMNYFKKQAFETMKQNIILNQS